MKFSTNTGAIVGRIPGATIEYSRHKDKGLTDMKIIKALIAGYRDGLESPDEFGCGLTYDSQILNEAYDMGVNYGQKIARQKIAEGNN